MELQSRLKFTEAEVQVKRKEAASINDKLAGTKRQLEEALHREDHHIQLRLELESELNRANTTLGHMEEEKQAAEAEIASLREEVRRSREQIQEKVLTVEGLEREKHELRVEARDSSAQLAETRDSLTTATRTIQDLEKQVQDLSLADQRELATRADLETLRRDNARMLKLLRSTKEYAQFQQLWEDAQGVSYLPSSQSAGDLQATFRATVSPAARSPAGFLSPASIGEDMAASPGATARPSDQELEWAGLEVLAAKYGPNTDPVNPAVEAENWVPAAVIKLANDFCTRFATEVHAAPHPLAPPFSDRMGPRLDRTRMSGGSTQGV